MMLVGTTSLPLAKIRRGKVRDVYSVDAETVLLVATDRVSAFDVVMSETVPGKGAVLTQLTAWWLTSLGSSVNHHMITADTGEILARIPALLPHADELAGRAMLCRRAEVFPVECVIRGYLSGSAWKEYSANGTLAGEKLAEDLRESDQLEPPLFSPATKADEGHDQNITVQQMADLIGNAGAELERLTRLVYDFGRATAAERGIIIADTKLEFGRVAGGDSDRGAIILVDEVLTPDSSRFWPERSYSPDGPQQSLDKQPLRDYLESERRGGRWNGNHPPPPLPDNVIDAMSTRYRTIFEMLTGSPLPQGAA
ncbi:MAG: phosphoribosylaminoimidazolesuccinocarboxamide synthase [Gemmatimonadota bacterium]|nr:phosphoribosylaminoimidazolesuccinocarboxamide synthase [Gemmatimonadota bacterium]